jgi:hypothetical protein
VDLAEKLLQAAHRTRTEGAIGGRTRRFALDPALARSMGLTTASYAALLRAADSARGPAPAGEGAAGRPRRRCGTGAPRARATNAGPKPPPPARQRLCRAGGMVGRTGGALMAAGLRIDKLLWFLRLARTRAGAGLGAGHIRLNGRRVERAHQAFPPAISSSFRWVRRCA